METRLPASKTSQNGTAPASIIRSLIRAYHDLIPRPRDRWGNRRSCSAAYHDPYPGDLPVDETWLRETLAEIEIERPARAAWLRHFYDHRLLAALHRFHAVRDEAEQELEAWNDRAKRENLAVDTELARLRAHATQAAKPHLDRAEALDSALRQAHLEAAVRVARIGRRYDPKNPSTEEILAVADPDLGIYAAELGLPDPRNDQHALLHSRISWVLTGLVGGLIGLSMGLMGRFLEADRLAAQAGQGLMFFLLGLAPATLGRKAISLGHRQLAERAYLGLPWYRQIALYGAAFGMDAAVLLTDLAVEREGLMRVSAGEAGIQSLSGGAVPTTVAPFSEYLAPLLITLGYVGYAAWEGYLAGRNTVLMNHLQRARSKAHAEAQRGHLADENVQAALAAVYAVRELFHERDEHLERARAAARPYEEQIATLESRRIPHRDALSDEQRARIQDAHDNLLGADWEFRKALERELDHLEPQDVLALFGRSSRRPLRHRQQRAV